MTFDSFINKIPEIKSEPLLASDAHLKMIPKTRLAFLNPNEHLDKKPKQSAVMMLFYPKENKPYLVLIERASYKGIHSAQIAFPGGKTEKGDRNLQETALRETQEEIGVMQNKIEIIKSFSQIYVPPSNFLIAPFLGVAQEGLHFIPQPSEVANIIELPIEVLLSEATVQLVEKTTSYASAVEVPAFVYQGYAIWGATAMILSELKETLLRVY